MLRLVWSCGTVGKRETLHLRVVQRNLRGRKDFVLPDSQAVGVTVKAGECHCDLIELAPGDYSVYLRPDSVGKLSDKERMRFTLHDGGKVMLHPAPAAEDLLNVSVVSVQD